MDKAEHLAWAKERALEYLPDVSQASASFISDLNKHDDLRGHPVVELFGMEMFAGTLNEPECRRLIEGTH